MLTTDVITSSEPETVGAILARIIHSVNLGKKCPCVFSPYPHSQLGDSVLEKQFWHFLSKTRGGLHGAIDQFPIGRYRVDCLIDCNGKAVVVELDGKAYHDAMADEIRDREILKSVDAIIRIPFVAMWHYPHATFAVLAKWFSRFQIESPATYERQEFIERLRYLQTEEDMRADEYVSIFDDTIQVWEVQNNAAVVGSPSGFWRSNKRAMMWIQHGVADQGILDRLYDKAGCVKEVR